MLFDQKKYSPVLGSDVSPDMETDRDVDSQRRYKYERWEIMKLPDELLVKILSNLDACELLVCKRVNKRWKNIIVTDFILACAFYRSSYPLAPALKLSTAVNCYHGNMRDWLQSFGNQGCQAVIRLDEILKNGERYFPERLFFATSNVLEEAKAFTGKVVCTLKHSDKVNSVSLSADEQQLVTASDDTTAKICRYVDGQWQEITTLPHPHRVNSAHFGPNGDYCATVYQGASVQIWKPVAEQWQNQVTFPSDYHTLPPSFSADGHYMAVAPHRHALQINQYVGGQWQKQTTLLRGKSVDHASFHPQDNTLVTVDTSTTVTIWQLEDQQWQATTLFPRCYMLMSAYFSPNGRRLLIRSKHLTPLTHRTINSVHIWHLVGGAWTPEATLALGGWSRAHFNRHGDYLMALSGHMASTIWHVADSSWNSIAPPGIKTFRRGCIGGNGSYLATEDVSNNTTQVHRFAQGQLYQEAIIPHRTLLNDICFTFQGNHILVAFADHTAQIWGKVAGFWQPKATLTHEHKLLTVHPSPSGRYVMTTTTEHTAHLWMLHNKKDSTRS